VNYLHRVAALLDEDRARGTPAQRFDADGLRARVGVQEHRPGKARRQDVKERFPKAVRGRPQRQARQRLQPPASKLAANHAHRFNPPAPGRNAAASAS